VTLTAKAARELIAQAIEQSSSLQDSLVELARGMAANLEASGYREGCLVTIVGHAPTISAGEWITAPHFVADRRARVRAMAWARLGRLADFLVPSHHCCLGHTLNTIGSQA
jgi:hypothetical protein